MSACIQPFLYKNSKKGLSKFNRNPEPDKIKERGPLSGTFHTKNDLKPTAAVASNDSGGELRTQEDT